LAILQISLDITNFSEIQKYRFVGVYQRCWSLKATCVTSQKIVLLSKTEKEGRTKITFPLEITLINFDYYSSK